MTDEEAQEIYQSIHDRLVKAISKVVASIEAVKYDSEKAHSLEDALRAEFIAYVADVGSPHTAELARVILKTDEIQFERWCA